MTEIEQKLKDFWHRRWPSFAPAEVLSPDGLAQLQRGDLCVFPQALDFLQMFRNHLDVPLVVNNNLHTHRGYRSPAENKAVGGETYSKHMQGVAFDVSADGMSVEELFTEAIRFGWHGVGKYELKGFVHMDIRPRLDNHQTVWEL